MAITKKTTPPTKSSTSSRPTDEVNHPPHYNKHPSGVECIDIAEAFNFNLGNALKYIWRAALKGGRKDLQKALWYIQRELDRTKEVANVG